MRFSSVMRLKYHNDDDGDGYGGDNDDLCQAVHLVCDTSINPCTELGFARVLKTEGVEGKMLENVAEL